MRLREKMPELDGATKWLNSKPIHRRDLIGSKPSLIHFWSVSCSTCKEAMPGLNKIRDEFANELHIIAVHMPRAEKDMDMGLVRKSAEEHGITQPIFVDNERTLTDEFKTRYVPAYYLFDTEGKLKHSQSGSSSIRMLRRRIDRVLGHTS
ncbi:TlpA family protein disulfide reductase [Virgibacillus siamensis]|uniref:TlpA family protein disulfide reductase n=1 Tax=Virgibacillus siamensis TaxID=480071 RepID=UPI0009852B4C|nr:TlpA disulfide reductase family protein [Virgibacillus siamensis]